MIYLPRVNRSPEQKSIRRQPCLDTLAGYVRESRDVLEDIFVGEVPAGFGKRHDLLSELLKTENRKLPAKRAPDDLTSTLTEGLRDLCQFPVQILI